MDKNILFNFLIKSSLCVLSTLKDNKPQSALMGFGISKDLEFIFGTSNISRKFSNIKNNPHVSVVVGSSEGKTVQYEGVVEFIIGKNLDKYKDIYFTQRPSAKKHESLSTQVYFKVNPTWIKYTDVRKDPWEVFELSDF